MRADAKRILEVDLSSGLLTVLEQSGEVPAWAGGRALGVAILRKLAASQGDNLDMPLVFASGVLGGSALPMTDRCTLTGISPLTGGIITESAGGRFARQLCASGYDGLVFKGRASSPVLLELNADGAFLRPASDLVGRSTSQIISQFTDGEVAVVGPSAFRGVRFASVITSNGEVFARGGLGTVMSSKNLVAVYIKGTNLFTGPVSFSEFDKSSKDLKRLLLASPFVYGPMGVRENGSVALVDLIARRGMLPSENFRSSVSGREAQSFNAKAFASTFNGHTDGCGVCEVACKRGKQGEVWWLPDYEAIAAFGGICRTSDINLIVSASNACMELGIDPVSAAGAIGCWAEINSVKLDAPLVLQLIELVAASEGDGGLIAMGAEAIAINQGQPAAAMTVKGLELPPFDPRGSCGLALAYAVSPHGGSHMPAWPIASEILRKPVPTDPAVFEGKARVVSMAEEANAAMDSMVFCRFASAAVELEVVAALVSSFAGGDISSGALLALGRQIVLWEREINRKCGIDDFKDMLPDRFFCETTDVLAPLDRSRFMTELESYQNIRRIQEAR